MKMDGSDTSNIISFFENSNNCSADSGNTYIRWDNISQCLEDTQRAVGFVLGCVAIVISCVSYFSRYICHQMRPRQQFQNGLILWTMFNLLGEGLGFIGAMLSHLLSTQIVFAFSLLVLSSLCCIHFTFTLCHSRNQKKNKVSSQTAANRKSKWSKICMYPFVVFLSAFSILILVPSLKRHALLDDVVPRTTLTTPMPARLLFGYMLGVMGAITHFCNKIVDVIISYSTVDKDRRLACLLVLSIAGDLSYFISVHLHSLSKTFVYLVLPWTSARLVSAGIDAGNLLQRFTCNYQIKDRRLSREDTDTLLSSDVDVSSDDSEEVVWMPLQTIQCVQPQYNVCASQIQILSESENYAEMDECSFEDENMQHDDKMLVVDNSDTLECPSSELE